MSCKANERHITFEEGCWAFHPNSVYHSVMLLYLQEERVSCQCTFGSRLHEEREKVNSLCECSKGSFLTPKQAELKENTGLRKRGVSKDHGGGDGAISVFTQFCFHAFIPHTATFVAIFASSTTAS